MTEGVFFFDSSALVKRYVLEPGTAWVLQATRPDSENPSAIVQVTIAEVAAALASKLRTRLITTEQFDGAVSGVIRDAADRFIVVQIDQRVILRGYDAVQLACGLVLHDTLVAAGETPLTFVTADQILLAAARTEGLMVEDPNERQSESASG